MKFRQIRLTDTLSFSASASQSLKIGYQDIWINGMLLDIQLPKTEVSPAANQDYLFRCLSSLNLGAGGDPYLSSGVDLRPLYWLWRLLSRGSHRVMNYPSGSTTISYQLPILFGAHPELWDGETYRDASAAIQPDSGLVLQAVWGAPSAMGSGITIGNAAFIGATLLGFELEPGDASPSMRPLWFTNQPQLKAAAGLGVTDPLDVGKIYTRSLIMLTNGAAPADNRTDGLAASAISEVGIVDANSKRIMYEKSYDASRASQVGFDVYDDNSSVPGAALSSAVASIAGSHNPGVYLIDWRDHNPSGVNNPWGLDLTKASPNAIKLAWTVDSLPNTTVTELHCAVKPY